MSADNYLSIIQKEGIWKIYMESASDEEAPRFEGEVWGSSESYEEIIKLANDLLGEEIIEYGYKVFNHIY